MTEQLTVRRRASKEKLQAFLEPYPLPVQKIARQLRSLIFTVAPTAIEQIDSAAKLLGYGFDRTYKGTICVIMPLKAGVNLGFPRGVELPDPTGLLVGTGKRARHIRLTEAKEVKSPALLALLKATVALTRR